MIAVAGNVVGVLADTVVALEVDTVVVADILWRM